jgi:3-deoxy-D-manno-octulosonic-acid transferase
MIMLVYSSLLVVGLLLSAPWWLFRMVTTDRYREGLKQRLGFVPLALREAAQGKRVVWLHAVSVGEVLAATRLVAELEAALGAEFRVVISTTTRTGQALAQQRFGAERVFYMPLDFAFSVRAWLRVLEPEALVLMESELWPRLLHECSARSIPVAVVNARMSDRSFRRAMKVREVWKHLVRKPTLWLAQSDEDARRLVALGARAETVCCVGNLKYDVRAKRESWIAELIVREAAGRPIVVAGSTVKLEQNDEDLIVTAAWREGIRRNFDPLLVIAPRHPEYFREVAARTHEYRSLTATEMMQSVRSERAFESALEQNDGQPAEVIVLDTIGDLASVYAVANVALVGGSFVPRGGHNPLEPAQFGVPVVMGSSFENFRDIVTKMLAADAIRIVRDEEELELAFHDLLSDPAAARAMGERGRQVFESQQGATARTVEALIEMMRVAR